MINSIIYFSWNLIGLNQVLCCAGFYMLITLPLVYDTYIVMSVSITLFGENFQIIGFMDFNGLPEGNHKLRVYICTNLKLDSKYISWNLLDTSYFYIAAYMNNIH